VAVPLAGRYRGVDHQLHNSKRVGGTAFAKVVFLSVPQAMQHDTVSIELSLGTSGRSGPARAEEPD